MAGGQERALRRRIRTIQATKKITRAMELIAASQIPRARARIAGSLPYVEGIEGVLARTAAEAAAATRLLGTPERAERALVVAIVGDRGQAGAYNSNVLRATERLIAGSGAGTHYEIISVGRKAISYFRFRESPVAKGFTGMSDRPSFEDARAVAAEVTGPFLAGEADLVQLISTRYRSAGVQIVETRQLLPLPAAVEVAPEEAALLVGEAASGGGGFYDFEPSPEDLLELLVPRYAEAVLYRALLEASVSEHTARQRAMAAATENAEELTVQYRRELNRARQESITTEIMEIVSGAEALRHSEGSVLDIDALFTEMNQEQTA